MRERAGDAEQEERRGALAIFRVNRQNDGEDVVVVECAKASEPSKAGGGCSLRACAGFAANVIRLLGRRHPSNRRIASSPLRSSGPAPRSATHLLTNERNAIGEKSSGYTSKRPRRASSLKVLTVKRRTDRVSRPRPCVPQSIRGQPRYLVFPISFRTL